MPDVGQQALLVRLVIDHSGINRHRLQQFDTFAAKQFPTWKEMTSHPSFRGYPLLKRIAGCASALLVDSGFPLVGQCVIGKGVGRPPRERDLFIPAAEPAVDATELTVKLVLQTLHLFASEKLAAGREAQVLSMITEHREALLKMAPQGINTCSLLRAAYGSGVPWRGFAGTTYQYGWGSRSRLLNSSFTDETPVVGVNLARNKFLTSHLLRDHGLPVADSSVANNIRQARQIARRLDFPLVTKPVDADGGRGVTVEIRNEHELHSGFRKARKFSPRVLVEKFCAGNDYRVHVLHGEVYRAVHRQPGGILGDGVSNVKTLLVELNARPTRGEPGSKSLLKRIPMDDEALGLLAEQGLDSRSIPDSGRFVRLRRAANVSSGGTPITLPLEEVHPDNSQLAISAAKLLRLDVAGIDLLMVDIAQPWHEQATVICEVNAQPQISPDAHEYLLQRLLEQQGRIPIVMMLGQGTEQDAGLQAILKSQAEADLCVGLASPNGIWVGEQRLHTNDMSICNTALVLLGNADVDVLLVVVDDCSMLNTGLPVDSVDLLLLYGLPGCDTDQLEGESLAMMQMLVSMTRRVLPCTDNEKLISAVQEMTVTADYCRVDTVAEQVQALHNA